VTSSVATAASPRGAFAELAWRPLAAGDLAYVAALEAQIHASPWTVGNFRDAIAAGYWASVGEREGRILVYGVLMLAAGEAQVLNLSVVPDARRSGLGRSLLRRFVAVAVERGAEQIFLEVRAGNAAAIALYAAEGFVPVARRTGYYPVPAADAPREDALVMRASLPLPRKQGSDVGYA
jgi:ribosomal-protein-alanine N-acetyltransferase